MTLIGTSLGGLVASRFAEIFPDLVDSLVLIAAAGLSVQAPVITNFAHLPVRITHDLRACVSQGVAPNDSIPQVIGEALFSGLGGRIVLGQFTGGWVRFLACVCVCVCARARECTRVVAIAVLMRRCRRSHRRGRSLMQLARCCKSTWTKTQCCFGASCVAGRV